MRRTEKVEQKIREASARLKEKGAPAYISIWQPFEEMDADRGDDEPLLAIRNAKDRSEWEFQWIEISGDSLSAVVYHCENRITTARAILPIIDTSEATYSHLKRQIERMERDFAAVSASFIMAKNWFSSVPMEEVPQEGAVAVIGQIRKAETLMCSLCYLFAVNQIPLGSPLGEASDDLKADVQRLLEKLQ